MKIKIWLPLILLLFISQNFFSQTDVESKINLTGNLYVDSKIILDSYTDSINIQMNDEIPGKKNAIYSGLFSAIIPGAGQFYNEDYWISAIFLGVEAALIVTAISYDKKGDDQTASFQAYADDYLNPDHNWSVVRYAEWLVEYQYNNDQELLNRIVISNDPNLPPWERVNWNELNAAETGSHDLPPHGEQQYYEVIGKYHQYSSGWNDFTGGGNKELISPNFTYYSGERGEANDYYNTSSTAVIGVYINHLLSAAEAIWGANRFNDNLTVSLRVQNTNLAFRNELVPTLFLKYSF